MEMMAEVRKGTDEIKFVMELIERYDRDAPLIEVLCLEYERLDRMTTHARFTLDSRATVSPT